jgi:hypothetical protein
MHTVEIGGGAGFVFCTALISLTFHCGDGGPPPSAGLHSCELYKGEPRSTPGMSCVILKTARRSGATANRNLVANANEYTEL